MPSRRVRDRMMSHADDREVLCCRRP
jgi:hypothetical protein